MAATSSKGFRTTYILMGAFAVLLVVLAIVVYFDDGRKSRPDGPLFENFANLKTKSSDINRLEIVRDKTTMEFVRQPDGRWRMTRPLDVRADSDRVEAIIGELLAARKDDKGTDVTKNPAEHALDNPPVKITLSKGERSATVSLGKTTLGGEQAVVYVLASEEPGVPHATRRGRLRSLFKEPAPTGTGTAGLVVDADDLRSRKLLGEGMALEAAPGQLTSVKLSERLPDGQERVLSLVKKDSVWRFVQPAGYGDVEIEVPIDKRNPETIYNLTSLLNTILSMEVNATKDFVPDIRDLAVLGLDPTSPGVIRIEVTRNDAVGTETLWIGKAPIKSELDKVYVRYGQDASVAQINGAKARMLRSLIENPSKLRESTLARLRTDRVDAINITQEGRTFELRKMSGKWKLKADGTMYDADTGIVDALLQKLGHREVKGFPPTDSTDASLGFDKPAVEISIWEEGLPRTGTEDWPATKGPPTIMLLFGKKDTGDIAYVRRLMGGGKADFKMPDSLLALAGKNRLDYVNIKLPPFKADEVRSLTFPRDGATWKIIRGPGDLPVEASTWTFESPEALKGKRASPVQIRNVLDSFNQTTTERVVAEKPTPEQLKTWGLDPAMPDFKLTLGFVAPIVDRTFLLGSDVKGKISVYATTAGLDFVFEWPLAKRELLTKDRLLDPILYHVELSSVKTMTLRGWVDPAKPGEPQSLTLERKPGGLWSVKGGGTVDPVTAEDFLMQVAKPLSMEQVTGKVDGKLDVKDGALEVTLDVEGGKPITLTLGGPADKDGTRLYAATNQHPGELFVLPVERLKAVKRSMAALLKP